MAESKTARKAVRKPAPTVVASGFTDEERTAMREHARELKSAGKRMDKMESENAVLEKIAAMSPADRMIGGRIHQIVKANAPALWPKLWYGMPAYANADGQVVCFFQDAQKFKSRYATLGFSDKAHLDEDCMWATSFALKELTPAQEDRIAALVKKAVG